jgi:hypothetical protein
VDLGLLEPGLARAHGAAVSRARARHRDLRSCALLVGLDLAIVSLSPRAASKLPAAAAARAYASACASL